MDLGLGNDYYDSFIAYQKLLLKEFDRMTGEYGFRVIDASRSVRRVANELRRRISRVIEDKIVERDAAAGIGAKEKQTPKLETPKLEPPKLESPKLETLKLETLKLETPAKVKATDTTVAKEPLKTAS
jgi:hypothetical protein